MLASLLIFASGGVLVIRVLNSIGLKESGFRSSYPDSSLQGKNQNVGHEPLAFYHALYFLSTPTPYCLFPLK